MEERFQRYWRWAFGLAYTIVTYEIIRAHLFEYGGIEGLVFWTAYIVVIIAGIMAWSHPT